MLYISLPESLHILFEILYYFISMQLEMLNNCCIIENIRFDLENRASRYFQLLSFWRLWNILKLAIQSLHSSTQQVHSDAQVYTKL